MDIHTAATRVSTYLCQHNWKLQVENVPDGYHVPIVHRNFATTVAHRETFGFPPVHLVNALGLDASVLQPGADAERHVVGGLVP